MCARLPRGADRLRAKYHGIKRRRGRSGSAGCAQPKMAVCMALIKETPATTWLFSPAQRIPPPAATFSREARSGSPTQTQPGQTICELLKAQLGDVREVQLLTVFLVKRQEIPSRSNDRTLQTQRGTDPSVNSLARDESCGVRGRAKPRGLQVDVFAQQAPVVRYLKKNMVVMLGQLNIIVLGQAMSRLMLTKHPDAPIQVRSRGKGTLSHKSERAPTNKMG